MMQEIQSILNRYEGRMEENERRVEHMIGSEAREAQRGQRACRLSMGTIGGRFTISVIAGKTMQ